MPFSTGVPVFAGLNEGSRDANLRGYEMPPLIPGRIPAYWKDRGIEVYLHFSSAVAIQRILIEVFNALQWSAKLPLPSEEPLKAAEDTLRRLEQVVASGNVPAVEYEKAKSEANRLRGALEGIGMPAYAKDGAKPQPTSGKTFVDTGVTLITDQPQTGVESKDSTFGRDNCWG